ncbi:hypothetical protein ABPG72_006446 [Tetrahymena utriculariae]
MFSSKLQFLEELNNQNCIFDKSNYTTPQKPPLYNRDQAFSSSKCKINSQCQRQESNYQSQNNSVINSAINSQKKDLFSEHLNERRKEAINNFMLNYENDLYYILNIPHHASSQQIKQQFKKLSLLYHPDKQQQQRNQQDSQENSRNQTNNDNEQNFIKILTAYNILSNDRLRQIYDEQGFQAVQNAMDKNSQDN